MDFAAIFQSVVSDPRYQQNLDWGQPRSGHPEGTVQAHITELEENLDVLRPNLSDAEFWQLRLLIHTHDTFKAEAKPGVAITDPESHASLARTFLAEFCSDQDLLAMVQYHDEPFALWRQWRSKGKHNSQRFNSLLDAISAWDLFLAFNIIDGCTIGKSREPLHWFLTEVQPRVKSRFSASDIID